MPKTPTAGRAALWNNYSINVIIDAPRHPLLDPRFSGDDKKRTRCDTFLQEHKKTSDVSKTSEV
jgi:hypothetical protein